MAKNNNPMSNDDEIPQILTELPNPWSNGKGMDGVNFDGNQKNGKNGSPYMRTTSHGQNIPDYGGINYDNTQTKFGDIQLSLDDDMQWESKQGVVYDPTNKFKDIHDKMFYETDISKHIDCVGMPDESINGNSSTDCYGG